MLAHPHRDLRAHLLENQPGDREQMTEHILPDGGTNQIKSAHCYLRGTSIRTARGDVPIETLRAGDSVMTACGEIRPIRWVGHRALNCRICPDPRDVWPIRIAAHAFGENLPDRDLYLSPGHAVRVSLIDSALVPIVHLLNSATIMRVAVDAVEYWHVELDSHDLLLANNLPAESYLDRNNRDFFIERGIRPHRPDAPVHPVLREGRMVELAREQLLSRAERLGWTWDTNPDPRLFIDGEEQQPTIVGDEVQFEFPASAQTVRLMSKTFVPADRSGGVGDPRRLGLLIRSMELIDSQGTAAIALDDPRLEFPYLVESNVEATWRWTDGELHLPKGLWSQCRGERIRLRLRIDASVPRGYLPPRSVREAPISLPAQEECAAGD
jgi:hypothetical protein